MLLLVAASRRDYFVARRAADLGLEVRFLDETPKLPGTSVSYDLLDVFGAALGVGGGIVVVAGREAILIVPAQFR